VTRAVDRDELVDLLSYALLKVPPSIRAALCAADPGRQRQAEALVADRVLDEMRHLEVVATPAHAGWRAPGRQEGLPLPVTDADLPYQG